VPLSYDEVETLLQLARDAGQGTSFESRLTSVTDHLATLIPYSSLTLMVLGPNGPTNLLCRNSASPAALVAYVEQYMAHDPMVKRGPFGSQEVVCLSDVVEPAEFGRDAFTGEFLPQQGMRFALGVSPKLPDGRHVSLGIHRDSGLGDFTAKERQVIRLASLDVGRAVYSSVVQEKVTALARADDPAAREGALVFDLQGNVLQADAGARALCGLLARDRGGVPIDQFVTEVRQLASVPRDAGFERPIALTGGGRVHTRFDKVAAASGPRVVGQLRYEPPTPTARLEAFAARHRLSQRERDVAALAGEGLGNRGIGFKLGISEITVGTHLSKVYRKTGLSNRTELARALVEDVDHHG
jgi:DNA-binding CsgD family transcriptional regulator